MGATSLRWSLGVVAFALGVVRAPVPAYTCSERQVKQIKEFVAGMRAVVELGWFGGLDDFELPTVDVAEVPGATGRLVKLDREGLRIDGHRVDRGLALDVLGDEVERERWLAAARGRPAEPELVAAIAADVPAREIAGLLDLARDAGYVRVVFVARSSKAPPVPPAPRPELAATLGQVPADRRRIAVAELVDDEITRCPAFAEDGSDFLPSPTSVLWATEDALLACGCMADVDRVLTLTHAWISPPAWLPISSPSLDLARVAAALAFAPDDPWSEFAPAMFDGRAERLAFRSGPDGQVDPAGR